MSHLSKLIIATVLSCNQFALAQSSALLPPDKAVSGASQVEWAHRWWQWAASFEASNSPVADQAGELCGLGQSGPVWYLAGTYGTRRTERTCRVPSGKHLFFPLINYVAIRGEKSDLPCRMLVAQAARLTDAPSALVLEVDGIRHKNLQMHRFTTPNCFSLISKTSVDAASDGYYVMLAPLPAGRHIVNFGGVLPSMVQAVTYRLLVE